MYEDKRNQIIGTVLSCMFFLIIGGFITCSYGQVSQIGKTAIKTAMEKNAVKAAVGKAIIDGFLNQNDILSNDFRQMYKNDTTLKGTAILPLTSQIEIEKKQRMLRDLLKKSSDSIISKTELNGRQFEYLNEYIKYLTKGTKCLQNKDSLQAIHHFISADSVIQKHPDIIKNDTLSKYHSQILFKIGLFYLTDKNGKSPERFEKALYYFERAEVLGNTNADTYADAIRTMLSLLKKRTEENNSETNNSETNSSETNNSETNNSETNSSEANNKD